MTIQLLLGIIIGMTFMLISFGIFLAIPSRRTNKRTLRFNEKSLDQLTIRNSIGHEQIAVLWVIAEAIGELRKDSKP